jgi:hypothetical protein
MEYSGNGYRIVSKKTDQPVWSVKSQRLPEVGLDVDVIDIGRNGEGWFGLVCRLENAEDYYFLGITADNKYQIVKSTAGEITTLKEGDLPDNMTLTEETIAHLRAECTGERLALSVNGQHVAEVNDSDHEQGLVGMAVWPAVEENMSVVFDNFVIQIP